MPPSRLFFYETLTETKHPLRTFTQKNRHTPTHPRQTNIHRTPTQTTGIRIPQLTNKGPLTTRPPQPLSLLNQSGENGNSSPPVTFKPLAPRPFVHQRRSASARRLCSTFGGFRFLDFPSRDRPEPALSRSLLLCPHLCSCFGDCSRVTNGQVAGTTQNTSRGRQERETSVHSHLILFPRLRLHHGGTRDPGKPMNLNTRP